MSDEEDWGITFRDESKFIDQELYLSTAIENLRDGGQQAARFIEYKIDPVIINCSKLQNRCVSTKVFVVKNDRKKSPRGIPAGIFIYEVKPLEKNFIKGFVKPDKRENYNVLSRTAANKLYEPALMNTISEYMGHEYVINFKSHDRNPLSVSVIMTNPIKAAIIYSSFLVFKTQDGYFMLGDDNRNLVLRKVVSSFTTKIDPGRLVEKNGKFDDYYIDPFILELKYFFRKSKNIPGRVKLLHFDMREFYEIMGYFSSTVVPKVAGKAYFTSCSGQNAGKLGNF